jgi:hypothetical protein
MHGMFTSNGARVTAQPDIKTVQIGTVDDHSDKTLADGWFAEAMRSLGINAEMLHTLTSDEPEQLRSCYRYASGERMPPGWLIVKLIRSEAGPQFMALIAANANWWGEHQRALKIGRAAIAADE